MKALARSLHHTKQRRQRTFPCPWPVSNPTCYFRQSLQTGYSAHNFNPTLPSPPHHPNLKPDASASDSQLTNVHRRSVTPPSAILPLSRHRPLPAFHLLAPADCPLPAAVVRKAGADTYLRTYKKKYIWIGLPPTLPIPPLPLHASRSAITRQRYRSWLCSHYHYGLPNDILDRNLENAEYTNHAPAVPAYVFVLAISQGAITSGPSSLALAVHSDLILI
ncbi:hypothetical protein R3P38DRAFT_3239579 [Favolaschia claudopus]|uniref:Uncharacterized protein n=1 Tax=Favolaschia claudopus TaxID=2862362 RepID=A0AAV9Z7L0_9AGAR